VIRSAVVAVVVVMMVGLAVPEIAGARPNPQKRAGWRRPSVKPLVPVATQTTWPRKEVMDLAEKAWRCGKDAGAFHGPTRTVIDYSLPSTARRFWVLDMVRRRVLFHELVAHGEGSGDNYASDFSNEPGSRQTSIGLFRTDTVYRGGNGYSLRLEGLEPGVNDLAMERRIVMHGASYVSPRAVTALGRLGRSWGCPALARGTHKQVIDRIKGGTAVFSYYPDQRWLRTSRYLKCGAVRVAKK
jgi:hypothetical protein